MKYTQTKDRLWYLDKTVYNDKYANQDFNVTDAVVNADKLNTTVIDWMIQVEEDDTFDLFLLHEFKEHFENFTSDLFQSLDKRVRKALKELLRQQGIYIPQGHGDSLPNQFTNLLTLDAVPKWPAEHLKLMRLCAGFKCHQIADDEEQLRQLRAPPGGGSSSPSSGPTTTTTQNSSFLLTNLSKLYTQEQKYSGEKYDILKTKIKVFNDLCSKVGIIDKAQFKTALSIMLTGRALQYYYDHIAPQAPTLTYDAMLDKLRTYFNTPQAHQMYLSEWHDTTLRKVTTTYPDKGPQECLEIVINKMNTLYQALSQDWGESYNQHVLAAQLLNACRGIEATTLACMKPAATFEGVAADLRNAVSMWLTCHPNSQFLSLDVDEQYYTNRQYFRNDQQGAEPTNNAYQRRRYYSQGGPRNNRFDSNNRQPRY